MTPARTAAYLGGASLLVAWLSSASGVQPAPTPGPAPRNPEVVRVDALGAEVQSQAARLRARMAAAPAARLGTRNPFAFPAAAPPARRPAAADLPLRTGSAAAEADRAEPPLELIGVAERTRGGATTRTAIVQAPGDQLFMVTDGQELAGRYRVSAIGADAVELSDLTTGATRRLGLK